MNRRHFGTLTLAALLPTAKAMSQEEQKTTEIYWPESERFVHDETGYVLQITALLRKSEYEARMYGTLEGVEFMASDNKFSTGELEGLAQQIDDTSVSIDVPIARSYFSMYSETANWMVSTWNAYTVYMLTAKELVEENLYLFEILKRGEMIDFIPSGFTPE